MDVVVGVTFMSGVVMAAFGTISAVDAIVDRDDGGVMQMLLILVAIAVGLCAISCAIELYDRLRADALAARRSDAIQESR